MIRLLSLILIIALNVQGQEVYLPVKLKAIRTYDMGGKVIHIDSTMSSCVIKNAIIEANPYVQIFDTTVTLMGCKAQQFSTAWFGAKSSIADNSVYLQKAINTCIVNEIANLFFADSYSYSQSLKICNIYKDQYVGVYLNMFGQGDMWSTKTTLTYTGNSFAVGWQVAKGGSFSKMRVAGNYVSPVNSGVAYYNTPFPERKGYDGLVIDYDGTKNVSGSTALRIEDVWVDGFDVLYNVSPNSITFNADCLTFNNIRCGNGRIGFQSGQAQEKGNQINNIVSWGNIYTLVSIGNNSKFQAGQYIIRNGNIANGCVQLFDISCSGWNSFAVDGLTVESVGRIGKIYAWTSTAKPSVVLDKMYIRFALKQYAGTQTMLTSNSCNIKITNSNLWYYGTVGEVMNFSGSMCFDNCDFDKSVYTNSTVACLK